MLSGVVTGPSPVAEVCRLEVVAQLREPCAVAQVPDPCDTYVRVRERGRERRYKKRERETVIERDEVLAVKGTRNSLCQPVLRLFDPACW